MVVKKINQIMYTESRQSGDAYIQLFFFFKELLLIK